jgi:hypothetical protein
MSSAARTTYLTVLVMAAGFLMAVHGLQYLLHVGSCGSGPNAIAMSYGPCPSGTFGHILPGIGGLLLGVFAAVRLGRVGTSLAFGLGFTMLGGMFAILGFVPAPGDQPTMLGLAIGAPFLLGGIVGFVFTVRAFVVRV